MDILQVRLRLTRHAYFTVDNIIKNISKSLLSVSAVT
jgi:hypothetical protein